MNPAIGNFAPIKAGDIVTPKPAWATEAEPTLMDKGLEQFCQGHQVAVEKVWDWNGSSVARLVNDQGQVKTGVSLSLLMHVCNQPIPNTTLPGALASHFGVAVDGMKHLVCKTVPSTAAELGKPAVMTDDSGFDPLMPGSAAVVASMGPARLARLQTEQGPVTLFKEYLKRPEVTNPIVPTNLTWAEGD